MPCFDIDMVVCAVVCVVQSLQLSGLRVLSSLAAGAAEGELPGEVLVPTSLLDRLLDLIRAPDTHQEVRKECMLACVRRTVRGQHICRKHHQPKMHCACSSPRMVSRACNLQQAFKGNRGTLMCTCVLTFAAARLSA